MTCGTRHRDRTIPKQNDVSRAAWDRPAMKRVVAFMIVAAMAAAVSA